jgi:hypothetical protein
MVDPLHFPKHLGTTRRSGFSSDIAAKVAMIAFALRALVSIRFFTMVSCAASRLCRSCEWYTAAASIRILSMFAARSII